MKNIRVILGLFVMLIVVCTDVKSLDYKGDDIVGLWLPSNGKARVQIYKKSDKYFGRIVWLREPNDPETGKPKTDKNNPEESMRSKPLLGFKLLKNFVYEGDGVWEDGTIYDPQNGENYSCEIKMKNKNTLDVRGYIGISLFGRTDVWKRIKIKK